MRHEHGLRIVERRAQNFLPSSDGQYLLSAPGQTEAEITKLSRRDAERYAAFDRDIDMVSVEPYNAIAVADGIGVSILDYSSFDRLPVLMAATPEFVDKNPDTVIAYLKAWRDVAADFKNNPNKVSEVIFSFFTSKGYKMSKDTFAQAMNQKIARNFIFD